MSSVFVIKIQSGKCLLDRAATSRISFNHNNLNSINSITAAAMDQGRIKPKRQRKRQSRTEVESKFLMISRVAATNAITVSSDSESDREDVRPNDVQEKVVKITVKENSDSRRKAVSRQIPSAPAEVRKDFNTLSKRQTNNFLARGT